MSMILATQLPGWVGLLITGLVYGLIMAIAEANKKGKK